MAGPIEQHEVLAAVGVEGSGPLHGAAPLPLQLVEPGSRATAATVAAVTIRRDAGSRALG